MTGKTHTGRRRRSLAAALQAMEAVVTKRDTRAPFGNDTAAVVTKTHDVVTFGNDTAMFVRVRRRKLNKGADPNRFKYYRRDYLTDSASYDVVRAVRINGKPRHKFIVGLGSLKRPIERSGWELLWFWDKALGRMRRRGLSEQQRRQIIAALIRKGVPKVTKAQCKEFCEGSDWTKPDHFADLFL
jgi:hypothetical protein